MVAGKLAKDLVKSILTHTPPVKFAAVAGAAVLSSNAPVGVAPVKRVEAETSASKSNTVSTGVRASSLKIDWDRSLLPKGIFTVKS